MKLNKKTLYLILLLILIFLPGGISAELDDNNETINNNDTYISYDGINLSEYNITFTDVISHEKTIFLISDNPGTNVLEMAASELLYETSDVNVYIRNCEQINDMSEDELYKLLKETDIFIAESITTNVDSILTNILLKHPELSNKQLFLILEVYLNNQDTSFNLIRYNTMNSQKIFENTNIYTNSFLEEYFKKTDKSQNYDDIYEYLTNGNGKNVDNGYNKAILYKICNDKDNLLNQMYWSLNYMGYSISYDEPNFTGKLSYGIYRERYYSYEEYVAKYFDPTRKSTIGILESNMYVSNQQLAPYYALIESLESKGFNVIPVVAAGGHADQLKVMVESFTSANDVFSFLSNPTNYDVRVDAIISMPAYGIGGVDFDDATKFFELANVLVFRAVHSDYVSNEEWELSATGLPGERSDKWWHVAISEAQGVIDATFVGGFKKTISNDTGAVITGYVPHYKNIDAFTDRISKWIDLRYALNINKKISLIYYNYPPGKDKIGSSYLSVITSIYNMLYELQAQGYDVGEIPKSIQELEDAMINYGVNIETWAPGNLEIFADLPNTILLPVSEYMAWFNTLDPISRLQVVEGPVAYIGELSRQAIAINYTVPMDGILNDWYNGILALMDEEYKIVAVPVLNNVISSLKNYLLTGKESDYDIFLKYKEEFSKLNVPGLNGWGEIPGNVMVVNRDGIDYFVIPGLKFGNIFIGPEPQRGWEADSDALYHSFAVAPTHQYLAAYYYLQKEYSDAMIFVGRHATHEWLPGKEILLSTTDFGNIVLGSVPQIYIYTVDGLAEAIQAKRRAHSVMISHLTSPMSLTSLYGNFITLAELLNSYNGGNVDALEKMRNIVISENYAGAMGKTNTNILSATPDQLVKWIDEYLYDIQSTIFPLGLHAIGEKWSASDISKTVVTALSFNFTYNGITTNLFDEVSKYMFSKTYKQLNALERERVMNASYSLINSLVYWDYQTIAMSLDITSTSFLTTLEYASYYINMIFLSIDTEMESILLALNGGYIPIGYAGDALDISILPTGKNYFHDQSAELPTEEAFEYGKILALLALSTITEDVEKVLMGIWCVETARDDGALVAVVLYLLGMEPVYSSSPSAGGRDDDDDPLGVKTNVMPKYVELADLIRPDGWAKKRIDVTIITSGLFRDLYSTQAMIMDNAFRVALARSYHTILENTALMNSKWGNEIRIGLTQIMESISYYGVGRESLDDNFVAKHWVEDFIYYKDLGYEDLGYDTRRAAESAITKIFAPPNGDYGAGISKAGYLSWTWEETDELAKFYLGRMGNMYSKYYWGESDPIVFERALLNAGTIITSRNTNQYGVVDNDDFADYWGGLSLAVAYVNGELPKMQVLMYANKNDPYISDLETVLNKELFARYFNPEWIKGMMNNGPEGARYISHNFAHHMMLWEITRTDMVQSWMWDSIYDIYVLDKYGIGVSEWLLSGNQIYANTDLFLTLLDATFNNYWDTSDEVKTSIAKMAAQSMIDKKIPSGNQPLMEYLSSFLDEGEAQRFNEAMYEMTQNSAYNTGGSQGGGQSSPTNGTQSGGKITYGGSSPDISSSVGTDISQAASSSDVGSAQAGSQNKAYEMETPVTQSTIVSNTIPMKELISIFSVLFLLSTGFIRERKSKK